MLGPRCSKNWHPVVRPPDIQDEAQITVDQCLQLACDGLWHKSGFTSVEKHWLDVRVKNPRLRAAPDCAGTSYLFEACESSSSFCSPAAHIILSTAVRCDIAAKVLVGRYTFDWLAIWTNSAYCHCCGLVGVDLQTCPRSRRWSCSACHCAVLTASRYRQQSRGPPSAPF